MSKKFSWAGSYNFLTDTADSQQMDYVCSEL